MGSSIAVSIEIRRVKQVRPPCPLMVRDFLHRGLASIADPSSLATRTGLPHVGRGQTMIRSVFRALGWVVCIGCAALGSVSAAQQVGEVDQRLETSCVLRYCADGLEIRLSDLHQTPPQQLPHIELIVDGKHVHCMSGGAANPNGVHNFCSDGHVLLSISEREGCDPYHHGQYHPECLSDVVIWIPGTPKHVDAHLVARTMSEVTVLPSYQRVRPNGDNCEPVCQVAKYSWVVKNPW